MRKLIVALVVFAFAAVAQAETLNLKVDGMVCSVGCVKKVNNALTGIQGVNMKGSKVALGTAKVDFDASKAKKKDIIAAIEKAGFKVAKNKK